MYFFKSMSAEFNRLNWLDKRRYFLKYFSAQYPAGSTLTAGDMLVGEQSAGVVRALQGHWPLDWTPLLTASVTLHHLQVTMQHCHPVIVDQESKKSEWYLHLKYSLQLILLWSTLVLPTPCV